MNPYEVLGVGTAATSDDLRKAYRDKARRAHPDAGGKREDFDELKLAYDVLSDPDRRARYDRTGKIDDDEADNYQAMVLNLLVRMIDQILQAPLEDDKLFSMSLLQELTSCIEAEIAVVNQKIEPTDRALRRIKRLKRRFKALKRGAANVLETLLLSRENDYVLSRKAADRDIKVRRAAMALLKDYSETREELNVEKLITRRMSPGSFFMPHIE